MKHYLMINLLLCDTEFGFGGLVVSVLGLSGRVSMLMYSFIGEGVFINNNCDELVKLSKLSCKSCFMSLLLLVSHLKDSGYFRTFANSSLISYSEVILLILNLQSSFTQ